MSEDSDLFGRTGGPAQLSLFGEAGDALPASRSSFAPNAATIRQRLQTLLAKARQARAMPWSERDARMWQTVFPQMANWLPDAEADQLRLEFAQEIERLKGR